MYLYHGTSMSALRAILEVGELRPRGLTKRDNWKHTVKSHPQCVYLSVCYAPYFGINAVSHTDLESDGACFALLRFNTDALSDRLVPDEDAVEQSGRTEKVGRAEMIRRTQKAKSRLHKFLGTDGWEQSINVMGNCAHWGPIALQDIDQISIVELAHDETRVANFQAMDPSISPLNYRYCKDKYVELTEFYFQAGGGRRVGTPHEIADYLRSSV